MKILFLNLWDGKLARPLQEFLAQQASADVLCFQEAGTVESIIPECFSAYQVLSAKKAIASGEVFEQAIYVHPRYRVTGVTELLQNDPEMGLGLGATVTDAQGQTYTIVNVHGIARACVAGTFLHADAKRDFPARIEQSRQLLEYLQAQTNPVILGGDFNVLPDTESIEC